MRLGLRRGSPRLRRGGASRLRRTALRTACPAGWTHSRRPESRCTIGSWPCFPRGTQAATAGPTRWRASWASAPSSCPAGSKPLSLPILRSAGTPSMPWRSWPEPPQLKLQPGFPRLPERRSAPKCPWFAGICRGGARGSLAAPAQRAEGTASPGRALADQPRIFPSRLLGQEGSPPAGLTPAVHPTARLELAWPNGTVRETAESG